MNICLAWSASDFNPTKWLFFIHSPKRNIYCSILKAIIKSLHNFFGTKIEIEFENEKKSEIKSSNDAESTHWIQNATTSHSTHVSRVRYVEFWIAEKKLHTHSHTNTRQQSYSHAHTHTHREYTIQTVSNSPQWTYYRFNTASTLSTCFPFWFSFNINFFSLFL